MLRFANTLILAALITLQGCATVPTEALVKGPEGRSGTAFPLMTVDAWDGSTEIMSAKSGDMVLIQKASIDHYVKLNTALKTKVAASMLSSTNASPDTIFYPAELRSGARIYCSTDMASKEVTGSKRVCLSDGDRDGMFERLWRTDEIDGASGIYAMHVYEMAEYIENPVAYTVYSEGEMPSETMGLKYRWFSTIWGKKSVEIDLLRQKPNGNWENARAEYGSATSFSMDAMLPKSARVYSARLEILEIDGLYIKYKVMTPFAEGAPLFPYKKRAIRTNYYYY